MPDRHDIIERLKRDELLDVAERFELYVIDRRKRAYLVQALMASEDATVPALPVGLLADGV